MADIRELKAKTLHTLKEEGIISVGRKAKSYVHTARTVGRDAKDRVYKDVLFINGCDESVPHPARYRVTHQREQLAANNISTGEVSYICLFQMSIHIYDWLIYKISQKAE